MSTKADVVRKRESDDLVSDLGAERREIFNLRFQQASEKAANPELIRALRKEVARIKTILRERELRGEE